MRKPPTLRHGLVGTAAAALLATVVATSMPGLVNAAAIPRAGEPQIPDLPASQGTRDAQLSALVEEKHLRFNTITFCQGAILGEDFRDRQTGRALSFAYRVRANYRAGTKTATAGLKLTDFEKNFGSTRAKAFDCDEVTWNTATIQPIKRTGRGIRNFGNPTVVEGDQRPLRNGKYDFYPPNREERRLGFNLNYKRRVLTLSHAPSSRDVRRNRLGLRVTIESQPRRSAIEAVLRTLAKNSPTISEHDREMLEGLRVRKKTFTTWR